MDKCRHGSYAKSAVSGSCYQCKIEKLQQQLDAARDHLINLQPHIAQLPERYIPFIDTYVDMALEALGEK